MGDNKKPLVSVIMPIYNVEDYLAESLDSVLSQTLKEIEVICVNDGSTDSSPDILAEYAALDSRIVLIDKPNGGYGKAVNRGLDHARGDWIAILEPDDIIDAHMYEDLVALSRSFGEKVDSNTYVPADIVKGSYWLYFHFEGEDPYIRRPNLMNCMYQGVTDLDIYADPEVLKHHPSVWSAIYRREFLEEHNIRMIEPKGAGWADNPWFFDTMLRAKRIVWTPAAYYYYRQTNPNASSNLKDFHLPFDRLRDIRRIYEELGIKNEKLLLVLYMRSFSYIVSTLLEEFGFPENDPEMKGLIQEVFDSFDEKLLLKARNGISKRFKDYYRDFTGKTLAKVRPREACTKPRISFIVPMRGDRRGLWNTLLSITDQMYEDIEIICVDCCSPDRSLEIAESLSKVDKRVRVFSGADSVARGACLGLSHARGEYVHFIRPGVTVGVWSTVRDMVRGLDATHGEVDEVFFRPGFPASRIIPRGAKVEAVSFLNEGIESDAALATYPVVYTRLYRRGFLEEKGISWDDPLDEHGVGLCVKAAALAHMVAFIKTDAVGTGIRDSIDRSCIDDESGLIERALSKYEVMGRAAEQIGTAAAWRVARSMITCHMAVDIAKIGRYRSGEAYFEALRNVFETKYGLRDAPRSDYCNYLDVGVLEEAFAWDYEGYAKYLLSHQQQDLINLEGARDSLSYNLWRVHRSGSYLFGKKVGRIAKKVIPRDVRREYIYRNVQGEG